MSITRPRHLRCVDNVYRLDDNGFSFGDGRRFVAQDVPKDYLHKAVDFAFDMVASPNGFHRDHRSGGTMKRMQSHVFVDTFHGKLGEWCLFGYFSSLRGYRCSKPDMGVYSKGIWDNGDLRVTNDKDGVERVVAIKTTKWKGNLLLLETADWSDQGLYMPSLAEGKEYFPNRFVLVRIDPFLSPFADGLDNLVVSGNRDAILSYVMGFRWRYDIPGFITDKNFMFFVENSYVIPKNSFLNSNRTVMDADNYYVASKWMHPLPNI